MSNKTNLTIKLDKSVRDEFSALCDGIGISMTGALNALIKQSIRSKQMNFSLLDENGFTQQESAELLRRIKAYKLNKSELLNNELIEAP